MKQIAKRLKAIENRLPDSPKEIKYERMPPELVETMEALFRRKMTEDEKIVEISHEPLSPELMEIVKRITG